MFLFKPNLVVWTCLAWFDFESPLFAAAFQLSSPPSKTFFGVLLIAKNRPFYRPDGVDMHASLGLLGGLV